MDENIPGTLPLFADLPTCEGPIILWEKVLRLNLSTAVGRLFHLLTDGEWHSSVQISGPSVAGLGYGSCLSTLRKMGVVPESRYHVKADGDEAPYYDYRLAKELIAEYSKAVNPLTK